MGCDISKEIWNTDDLQTWIAKSCPDDIIVHSIVSTSQFRGIGKIPLEVKYLIGLSWFQINCESISYLPCELFYLINLTTLDLFGNYITDIPQEIQYLDKLETLNLSCNKIKSIHNIKNLKNLKYLYCPFNYITALPLELSTLTNLAILDCTHNKINNINTGLVMFLNSLYKFSIASNPLKYNSQNLGNNEIIIIHEPIYIQTTAPNVIINDINIMSDSELPPS